MDSNYLKQLSILMFITEDFKSHSIDTIIDILKLASQDYYNGEQSFLTDSQYDKLYRYVEKIDPSNPFLKTVGSLERSGKVLLPYKMGSLDQCYEGDFDRWTDKYNLQGEDIIITDKLDGTAALLIYQKGMGLTSVFSRGDGVFGSNITRHFKQMNIPMDVSKYMDVDIWAIRAEVILTNDNFNKIKSYIKSKNGEEYKNARNCVSGMMNAKTVNQDALQLLSVVAYSFLDPIDYNKEDQLKKLYEAGFETANYSKFKSTEINDSFLTLYTKDSRIKSKYALDGIVLEVNSHVTRNDIEPTKDTLNPAFARKFKVPDDSNFAISTVEDVEWNISKDGYLKPRVRIAPVELAGVTVTYATGFNVKFIIDNKIGIGSEIELVRAGDVIPYIIRCTKHSENVSLPNTNLIGDWQFNETGVDAVLSNPDTNLEVRFQKVLYFFETLNVENLKEQTIRKLFSTGYDSIEKILNISELDLADVINSKIVASKIKENLIKRFTDIPLYEIMGASSLFGRGSGIRRMKKLYNYFKGDINNISYQDMLTVDGFDAKTAKPIIEGLSHFNVFLNTILTQNTYISLKPFKFSTGSWTGQKVVFTGFRNKLLEDKIQELGGEISSSISKKTTLLVADNVDGSSTKLVKAKSLGIEIISETDLVNRLS